MIEAMGGRPCVLAFVKSWDPAREEPANLAAMRAQLRGLGAVLVVLSDAGAWSFRPDDDLERFAPGDVASIEATAADYGVAREHDAVFVLDAAGKLRFSHHSDGPLETSLAEALAAAGEALLAQPAAPALMFNRREWALTSLVSGFAFALFGCKGKGKDAKDKTQPGPAPVVEAAMPAPTEYDVTLDINGKQHQLKLDPRASLLDVLRERLDMPGTKKGCDHGQCGACTVHADGRPINACLTLAIMAQGQKVTTIEGLAQGDTLHPVQAAFIEHDGFQCGYCTPGQIMRAVALIAEKRATTDAEIREQMSGNLCRCGAYPNIIAAVKAAQQKGA